MDFLRNQFLRIQLQLKALSATQRMLAGSLVVIMVMTLFYWTKYAGDAEMEPVLDQALAAEDVSRIQAALQSKGIPFKNVGDRLMVPTDRKMEVMADLAYAQLLPRDTKSAFDEIISKTSPLDTSSREQQFFNRAKEMTLAQIIKNFPGVSTAAVMLDQSAKRMIGEQSVVPTATVSINMRSGGKADQKLVDAAADLVAGAVAGLSKGQIHVIADGVRQKVHDASDPNSGSTDEYIDKVRAGENYYADKLLRGLPPCEGAMVSVTVVPNQKRIEEKSHMADPKGTLVKPKREDTASEENTTTSKPGGDAGVGPNVAADLNAGSGGGEGVKSVTEKNQTENAIEFGVLDRHSIDPGNDFNVTGASVLLPRSYFVSLFKRYSGSDKEPDDIALKPLMDAELTKFRNSVKSCLPLKDDSNITVNFYTDLLAAASTAVPQAASSAPISIAVTGHVKEIAIGALALLSLFMMSMMVKKGAPIPVLASPVAARMPDKLSEGEEAIGEVGEGGNVLDGMELDDDSVRTQQMLDQVSTMVKDNPDGAANLVKRWLSRA